MPRLLSFLNRSQLKTAPSCVRLIVGSLVHSSWTLIIKQARCRVAEKRNSTRHREWKRNEERGRKKEKRKKETGKQRVDELTNGQARVHMYARLLFLSEPSAASRACTFFSLGREMRRASTCYRASIYSFSSSRIIRVCDECRKVRITSPERR